MMPPSSWPAGVDLFGAALALADASIFAVMVLYTWRVVRRLKVRRYWPLYGLLICGLYFCLVYLVVAVLELLGVYVPGSLGTWIRSGLVLLAADIASGMILMSKSRRL